MFVHTNRNSQQIDLDFWQKFRVPANRTRDFIISFKIAETFLAFVIEDEELVHDLETQRARPASPVAVFPSSLCAALSVAIRTSATHEWKKLATGTC